MRVRGPFAMAGLVAAATIALTALAQPPANAPIPNIPDLMKKVVDHQKELEKVRENYTFTSEQKTEDIDANGHVTKTETEEDDDFFVNGHQIERTVKKDGKPLIDHDEQKESERVTKLVEKAEKTPPDQPLEGQTISISRLLDLVDVSNLRRDESFRSRPTFLLDFIGRKDAKALNEDERIVKALRGTLWIDEADREISHIEVVFNEDFHFGWGILGSFKKGSKVTVDQAPEADGLWLPVNYDFEITGKVLLVGRVAARGTERHYDFKRFNVESQQSKTVDIPSQKQP